jgi:hypothetical protein
MLLLSSKKIKNSIPCIKFYPLNKLVNLKNIVPSNPIFSFSLAHKQSIYPNKFLNHLTSVSPRYSNHATSTRYYHTNDSSLQFRNISNFSKAKKLIKKLIISKKLINK